MPEYSFKIRETSIDRERIQKEIAEQADLRKKQGVYEHFDFSRVTSESLSAIRDRKLFLSEVLKSINFSCSIDISSFNIPSKLPGLLSKVEKNIKFLIFKILGFYTFRLFNQQREYNKVLSLSVSSISDACDAKLTELEERISKLG